MSNTYSTNWVQLERVAAQWNSEHHEYLLGPYNMQQTHTTVDPEAPVNIFIDGHAVVNWRVPMVPSFSTVVTQGNQTTQYGAMLSELKAEAEERLRGNLQEGASWSGGEAFLSEQQKREEQLRRWWGDRERLQRDQEPNLDDFFPLLELPMDVFNQVIDHVLAEQYPLGIVNIRTGGGLTSIFRATSATRVVALWRLLQGFTFLVSERYLISSFRFWLQDLDQLYGSRLNEQSASANVRSLAFPFFDWIEEDPALRDRLGRDLLLMRQRPNLTYLSIHFRVQSLNRRDSYGDPINRSLSNLRYRHKLWYLLNLKSLKSLYLSVTTGGLYGGFDDILPLFHIQGWFQKQFDTQRRRGQREHRVEVKVFSFGGGRGDIWQEIRWDGHNLIQVVQTCQGLAGWPLIPCIGFVHAS